MVKVPMQKIRPKMILFFIGKRTLNRSGMGMQMMIKSLEMLNTAFVMRWFVAAEHCFELGGTAQYWLNGLHHTPRYNTSMTTNDTAT